jgi:hypothetical protein
MRGDRRRIVIVGLVGGMASVRDGGRVGGEGGSRTAPTETSHAMPRGGQTVLLGDRNLRISGTAL